MNALIKRFSVFALFLTLLSIHPISVLGGNAPYQPEVDTRFHAIEDYDKDGARYKKVARATYDVSVDGGAAGSYDLGVKLPAKALLANGYIYFPTQFVNPGSSTIALQCEDSANILAAADLSSNVAGSVIPIKETGTQYTLQGGIGSACEITAVVSGTTDMTAGKANLFLEYYITD